MLKLLRFTTIFLLSLILGSFTVAYASSLTDSLDRRGEGASQVSGWVVSNIHYNLGVDPAQISSVEFDLNAPAGKATVKLSSTSSTYFPCINRGNFHWSCAVGGVQMTAIDELRVIAVGE